MAPVSHKRPAPPRVRPERRTRTDVIVAVALTVLVVAGFVVLTSTADTAGSTSVPAGTPLAPIEPASLAPAAFTEAWHAPSGATKIPVVSGNAVVTADGSTVVGHDPVTGATSWSYRRDVPLCAVTAGFSALGEDYERVLALYAGHTGWCSELTALRPDTGTRAGARNPDLRPGTQLLSNGTVVAGTAVPATVAGPDGPATDPGEIEVMRYDLVRTTEYGRVDAPVQPATQPRPDCTHASTLLGPGRVGVIERCPGEPTDRLTTLTTDESDDQKPVVQFSQLLPVSGATIVAISADRVAVAVPGPARLLVFGNDGGQLAETPIAASDAELAAAANPTDGTSAASSASRGSPPVALFRSWWTGSSTILLDPDQLVPVVTVTGTLGPAIRYGDSLLVPVPAGIDVVGPEGSTQGPDPVERTIPVARPDPSAPVRLSVQGDVLLEQRGSDLTALVPAR